jgi:nitrous oxidase accessory protein NosD
VRPKLTAETTEITMQSMLARFVATASAATLTFLLGAIPAAATDSLACGDSITADTRLSASLSCAEGPALRVDVPGVTLDLNGYTVSGASGIGIAVTADGVRVRGGTVRGFTIGVWIGPPELETGYVENPYVAFDYRDPSSPGLDVELSGLTIRGAASFGAAVDSATVVLSRSRLLANGPEEIDYGVLATHDASLRIVRTDASGNGSAVGSWNNSSVSIEGSTLSRNENGAYCAASRLDITASTVSKNTTGAWYAGCAGSRVTRSFFGENVRQVLTFDQPRTRVAVGCTVFLGGGPVLAFPKAPCW